MATFKPVTVSRSTNSGRGTITVKYKTKKAYDAAKSAGNIPKPRSSSGGSSRSSSSSNLKPVTSTVPKPNNYTPPSGTNYVQKGGQTLNDILYLKRTYEQNPNNTGLQSWASNAAKDYYSKLDPTLAKQVQGMNANQLEAYINSLGNKSNPTTGQTQIPVPQSGNVPRPRTTTPRSSTPNPGAFVPTPPKGSTTIPAPKPSVPSLNWDEIQKYVDQQLAAELTRQRSAADQAIAAGQLTAEQQTAALRQAAERLRADITEQRNIENVENQRRLNPFSGRSDYALGMIERERAETDRALAENQQMQEAQIQQNLAQLRNQINAQYQALQQTQGAERERMLQALRESERQYDLQQAQLEINRQIANSQIRNTDFNQQLAQWQANRGAYEFDQNFGLQEGALTGNYRGTPTLAAQQFAWGQQMDIADRTGQLNGAPTLAAQQLALQNREANWGAYMDIVDRTGNLGRGPQSNWSNLVTNANAGAPTLAYQQFQEDKRRFDVDTALRRAGLEQDAQQFAQQMGLNWAQLDQRQKEFIADQAWRQKNYDLDVQKMNAPQPNQLSANEMNTYVRLLNDRFGLIDPATGSVNVRNPYQLRQSIIGLNLPDEQTIALLNYYGLPIQSGAYMGGGGR